MRRLSRFSIRLVSVLLAMAGSFSCREKQSEWQTVQQKLTPLYALKSKPMPGDWMAQHKEPYQSFEQYVQSKPTRSDNVRNKIYITRIGAFSPKQQEIVAKTARYLWLFYGLQIKYLTLDPSTDVLKQSRRYGPENKPQLSTQHLIKEVLAKQLPTDAAVLIGLTATDLYPSKSWNFVFGQASLKNRVGVWSMNRFGNPDNPPEYEDCLLYTIKTAAHEIGHMFSLRHCVKYECCMNGSNDLYEVSTRPTYFCPECLTKICWNLRQDPRQNLLRTRKFWMEERNQSLIGFYDKNLLSLEKE
jgi:archaemetzincin